MAIELHTGIDALTTPTYTLYADGSDTALDAGTALTEATNRFGVYTFTTVRTGLHLIHVVSGGTVRWYGWAVLAASGTIVATDARTDVDGYSLEDSLKLIAAACAGKLSGAGTATEVFRAADDSKARITATVDSSGNRSAITLDATG